MPTELAREFRVEVQHLQDALQADSPALADLPWRPGGWTRKQIVGHLLDSACNNRQRFVRAAIEGQYAGPGYAQDAWVAAHGYSEQSWATLLRWWQAEHEILAAAVDRIPQDRLAAQCVVGSDPAVTLEFLVRDYIRHQYLHLNQMQVPSLS